MKEPVVKSKPTYWSGVTLSKYAYESANTLAFQKNITHGILAIEFSDGDLRELLQFIKDNFSDEWNEFIQKNGA